MIIVRILNESFYIYKKKKNVCVPTVVIIVFDLLAPSKLLNMVLQGRILVFNYNLIYRLEYA